MQFKPYTYKKRVKCSEYIKKTRIIDGQKFSFTQTPFFEETTDAACDLAHNYGVVICCPAQLGKSTMIENCMLYYTVHEPANTMLICDTKFTAQKLAKNRLKPFLYKYTGLDKEKKTHDVSRELNNFTLAKGAQCILGSSNSASDLCSTPCKYLFCDELDRWSDELDKEGDPLTLAKARQMRFRGMFVETSTPTLSDGRILVEYRKGSREVWGVDCDCGEHLSGEWKTIDFSGKTPLLKCPKCGTCFTESEIIARPHYYKSELENYDSLRRDKHGRIVRSFRIYGAMCHQFINWQGLREMQDEAESTSYGTLQSFYNTKLAEVCELLDIPAINPTDCVKAASMRKKVDEASYTRLVAGVDTHDDGFYYSIYDVDAGGRFYCVEYQRIRGDMGGAAVWKRLQDKLVKCSAVFMDAGGHYFDRVLEFSAECLHLGVKVYPILGAAKASENVNIIESYKRVQKKFKTTNMKIPLFMVGVNHIKCLIDTALRNFNKNQTSFFKGFNPETCDKLFFRALTSEIPRTTKQGIIWERPRQEVENEALDTCVYAYAANYFFDTITNGEKLKEET